jgi:hypothetical protein
VIELNTENDFGATADIQVMSMLGQIVYTNQVGIANCKLFEEVKLDASVPSGNYLVRVTIGSKVYKGNMIYQK